MKSLGIVMAFLCFYQMTPISPFAMHRSVLYNSVRVSFVSTSSKSRVVLVAHVVGKID